MYIEKRGSIYKVIIHDGIPKAGCGGTDIPGREFANEFKTLREASSFMYSNLKQEYNKLMNECQDYHRQRDEAANLLRMYFDKYGDQRNHPEFSNYKELSNDLL